MAGLNTEVDLAWGEVTNVTQVPSRGVTRITIEVPDHHHVPATMMFFKKRAIVIPWECPGHPVPYGVTKLSRFYKKEAQSVETAQHSTSGFVPARQRNFVKESGILCNDIHFWAFLAAKTAAPVESEGEAADALRALLSIASRAELAENRTAQSLFTSLVQEFREMMVSA